MASEAAALPSNPRATLMPSHDLRQMGLESASQQLHVNVADLGEVFEARARNDVAKCPVCRVAH